MKAESKTLLKTADIFKALGDGSRLKILKLIAAKGNILCVGFIARQLGLSQPAVSQHLKLLKNVGILTSERRGYHVHYSINADVLEPYGINTLAFLESFGAEMNLESSCEFKDEVETCGKYNS